MHIWMGDSWSADSEYEASPLQRSGDAVFAGISPTAFVGDSLDNRHAISFRPSKATGMTEMTEWFDSARACRQAKYHCL